MIAVITGASKLFNSSFIYVKRMLSQSNKLKSNVLIFRFPHPSKKIVSNATRRGYLCFTICATSFTFDCQIQNPIMKKVSKKELRSLVLNQLSTIITNLHIEKPSKKTTRLMSSVSKKLSVELSQELKKQFKKMEKAASKISAKNNVAKSA
jgi:hypothetical protein